MTIKNDATVDLIYILLTALAFCMIILGIFWFLMSSCLT